MIKRSEEGVAKGLRFRNTYEKAMDENGRVSFPTKFFPKDVITYGEEGDLLYLIRENYGFRVDLFDRERDDYYNGILNDPEAVRMQITDAEHYFGDGEIYSLEKSASVPRLWLGHAYGRINKNVSIRGMGDYFEIRCLHSPIVEINHEEENNQKTNGFRR